MVSKGVISVSTGPSDWGSHFMLEAMGRLWTNQGYRFEAGQNYRADADVCILHHNLSVLDPARLPVAPAGVRVLNGHLLDISKRVYSSLLLAPGDDWPGQVIIKTNLNHFGLPELRLRSRSLVRSVRSRLASLSWRLARSLPRRTYPVVARLSDVPDWVWADDALIVEKFMPEREGELYCLRGFLFLGSKSYGYRLFATHPLVKTGTMVRYEYIDEPPASILQLKNTLGFDFGKFDYVVHDGVITLLDANKTPTFVGSGESPRFHHLASGIEDFLT